MVCGWSNVSAISLAVYKDVSARVSVNIGVAETKVAPATESEVETKYVPAWSEVVDPDASKLTAEYIKVSRKSCSVMACTCVPFQYTGNVFPVSVVVDTDAEDCVIR